MQICYILNLNGWSINDYFIVLNFDLSNTIIARNPYDFIETTEVFVSDIIAKMAWGEVIFKETSQMAKSQQDYKEATWELKHHHLSLDCPNESLISYRDYVNFWYQFKYSGDANNPSEEIIQERNNMLINFISNEGKIFKPNFDKVIRGLKLPSGSVIKGDISDSLRQIYESKKYFLIPAFFRTLLHLRKRKRDFSITFRTHGKDLINVIEEFNNFWDGNHPTYNGENGTHLVTFNGSKKNTKDYRIKQKQTGLYFRFGKELADVNLIVNTLERHQWESHDQLIEHYGGQIEEGTINLHTESIEENYSVIMDILMKYGSLALNDDYTIYMKNNRDPDYGKLLLIDQYDYSVQHIFFDDLAVSESVSNIDKLEF